MIVEDSIIRGTTSRNRVQNLRGIGMKEIHMVSQLSADSLSLSLRH